MAPRPWLRRCSGCGIKRCADFAAFGAIGHTASRKVPRLASGHDPRADGGVELVQRPPEVQAKDQVDAERVTVIGLHASTSTREYPPSAYPF